MEADVRTHLNEIKLLEQKLMSKEGHGNIEAMVQLAELQQAFDHVFTQSQNQMEEVARLKELHEFLEEVKNNHF